MKLHIRKGIDVAVVKSGLTHKEFRERLGIKNNMTWWNRRHSERLTLLQAVEIAEVAGITVFDLIKDMQINDKKRN